MSGTMTTSAISLREANEFVAEHHRHHGPQWGHKYSLAAYKDGQLVGVAIVGRPSARKLDDGKTLEVTRLATDGTRNACSCLYAAAWREARKRGYSKIITYILESEPGTSLRAAGWTLEAVRCGKPGGWENYSRRGKERAEAKEAQLSLFPPREPVREYKQRWSKEDNHEDHD